MRGRHVFGASSQSAARCFEWKVVQYKINCGLPKFLTSEFLLNEKIGFRERCTQIHAANLNQLWNKLFVEVLGLSAPKSGGELCGFHDEPLARKMHMHHRGGMPEINSKKEFQALSDRWKRFIRSHLGEAFEETMTKLCPHDPALAFHCLLDSVQWQSRWLPENSLDLILQYDPMVRGLVNAHQHAPKECKTRILSLVAPHFKQATVCSLFNVKPPQVTVAKLHGAEGLSGQPVPKQVFERMRLAGRTFAFLHQWCRSSYAVRAGDASDDKLVRLEIRDRLHQRYATMAKEEHVEAVSIDHFRNHMKDGFKDETMESCCQCCNGCVDGWNAFYILEDFIQDPQYGFPDRGGGDIIMLCNILWWTRS